MSSDENDSFVILGSTPTPSMDNYGLSERSFQLGSMVGSAAEMQPFSLLSTPSIIGCDDQMNKSSATLNSREFQLGPEPEASFRQSLAGAVLTKEQSINNKPLSSSSTRHSLAEQFILGEIDAKSLQMISSMRQLENQKQPSTAGDSYAEQPVRRNYFVMR